jgi:hypothetical protein
MTIKMKRKRRKMTKTLKPSMATLQRCLGETGFVVR